MRRSRPDPVPPAVRVGRPALALQSVTNEELYERYCDYLIAQRYARSTREHYSKAAFQLCGFLGRKDLRKVTHLDIRAFLSDFARRSTSPDGVPRCLWALRSFFDFLYIGGVVDSVAPRLIKARRVSRKLPRVLSERDMVRLIGAAGSVRNKAMFELLYASGCRIGELLAMDVEDVDFSGRCIRVSGKTGERIVLFGSQAGKSVRRYLAGRTSGPLFVAEHRHQVGCIYQGRESWFGYWKDYSDREKPARRRSVYLGTRLSLTPEGALRKFHRVAPRWKRERPVLLRHLTGEAVRRALRYAAHRVGLGRVTAHTLRHSFATHMLKRGVDIRYLQLLLGHSDLRSTQLYTKVDMTTLRKAYRAFHPRSRT